MKLIIPIVPPGPAHAQELVGHCLMVGGEHRAERGGDDVELAVAERQRLGVGLDPLELDSPRAGLAAARLEVLRREVRGHDLRPGLGGADGHVARAGGHVEHALAGGDPARLHEHRPELPDRLLGEPVVVAERPHRPLGGLVLAVELAVADACCAVICPPISSILASAATSHELLAAVRRSMPRP